MAGTFSPAAKQAMLNSLPAAGSSYLISLHSGDPGPQGLDNKVQMFRHVLDKTNPDLAEDVVVDAFHMGNISSKANEEVSCKYSITFGLNTSSVVIYGPVTITHFGMRNSSSVFMASLQLKNPIVVTEKVASVGTKLAGNYVIRFKILL